MAYPGSLFHWNTLFYSRNVRLEARFFYLIFFAGLFQMAWYNLQCLHILPSLHYYFKGTGAYSNPAILGLCLTLAFLSGLFIFSRYNRTWVKIIIAGGLILLLTCILALHSRASWIALLCGASWFLFGERIIRLQDKPLFRQLYVKLLLITAFLCLILYLLYLLRPESVHGRVLIWQVLGEAFAEAPWLGHGPLQAAYMPMQATWFMNHPDSPFTLLADNNLYAFNEYLRIATESGLPGLAGFTGLTAAILCLSCKGDRTARRYGTLLLAIFSFGLFSYPFSIGQMTALTVILLGQTVNRATPPASQHTVTGKYFRFGLPVFFALFLLLSAHTYWLQKKADLLLREAQYTPSLLTGEKMKIYMKRLSRNPDFMSCYGKTLCNHQLYGQALPILEIACQLKPSSDMMCDLGRCYQAQGHYRRAAQCYREASYMVPAHLTPHYYLFRLYREIGEAEKAIRKARELLVFPVKVVNTSVLRIRGQARSFLKENQENPIKYLNKSKGGVTIQNDLTDLKTMN